MDDFRLETDRLILRPWTRADVDPFMARTNDDDVMRWLNGVQPRQTYVDLCGRMMASQARDGFSFWIMQERCGGDIVGFCGPRIAGHPGTPVCGELELGWRLAADRWGLGLALEAARATIDWCRTLHPAHRRVIAYTVMGNVASQGLMKRLGMAYRGDMDFDYPAFPRHHPLCRHITYALDLS